MSLCKSRRFFGRRTSLIVMLAMTGSFFVAEITVGHMTNSSSLVADSFHMLSDVLSLIIGFLAVVYSGRSSRHNTYGWARAEVLGALANAVFLLALCFSIVVSAIQRLIQVEEVENPLLIIYVGSAGLLINLIGLLLFHGHSHGHDHDHDHHHHHHLNHCESGYADNLMENRKLSTSKIEEASESGEQLNMKGVFLHVLGDALGSVVVLISALTIYFVEGDWKFYIDPVMSLCIASIIIFTTWPLLKRSGSILLQSPPIHIDKDEILIEIRKIHGVQAIHDFHVWQLSGSVVIASAHVTMHKEDSFNETAVKMSKFFHNMGVHSLTLQPEFYDCSEGQSICGSDTCHYLEQSSANAILDLETRGDEDATSSLQRQFLHPRASTCLLPCVSPNCKKFRCCSSASDRKVRSFSEGEPENGGLPNPCFINVGPGVTMSNYSKNETPPKDESAGKSATLPRIGKLYQNYSAV